MTTISNFKITVADCSTRDICSVFLVGGFDEDKNHYSGRQEFRGKEKQAYRDMCMRAERGQTRVQRLLKGNRFEKGDRDAWLNIQLLIVDMLKSGACKFRGMEYSFEVDAIDPQTLDFLMGSHRTSKRVVNICSSRPTLSWIFLLWRCSWL